MPTCDELSVAERRARERRRPPPCRTRRTAAGSPPLAPQPGQRAGGAGGGPAVRPRAGAARPDDGLAVHLLPGRRGGDGGGPAGHPGGRAARPAVRRRAPVQLRGVRLAGAPAGVRRQRLRRDAARAVRVRREAHGGQLRDRGPRQRVLRGRREGGRAASRPRLPDRDGATSPSSAPWTSGTPAWTRTRSGRGREELDDTARRRSRRRRARRQAAGARAGEAGQAGGQARRQGGAKAHTRDSLQALSKLGEMVGGRYRIVSQPPVVIPLRELAPTGPEDRADRGRASATSSAPTARPCSRTGGTCSSSSRSWTSPARWWASAASAPARTSCCCRGGTARPAVPAGEGGDHVGPGGAPAAAAATGSTASGWCRGSG